MTGPQLKEILFSKHGDATAFAEHIGSSPQNLYSKFKSNRVNRETLSQYADFKGYDVEKFLKWADGPLTNGVFGPIATPDSEDAGKVCEEEGSYTNTLNDAIIKVMRENIELHETLAERGKLIITLLDKK